ncbi:AAA domain-containing protein [Nocardia sp. alder85J]|uniref:AAA domain-containing protein n=1 Tax=Nocardia sp. alder85J TaxID=2862949 RepID=UPI003A4DFA83
MGSAREQAESVKNRRTVDLDRAAGELRALRHELELTKGAVDRVESARRRGLPSKLAELELLRTTAETGSRNIEALRKRHQELEERYRALAQDAQGEIIRAARLVATTLARSRTNPAVAAGPYDVVLVDEVGAAPLPRCSAGRGVGRTYRRAARRLHAVGSCSAAGTSEQRSPGYPAVVAYRSVRPLPDRLRSGGPGRSWLYRARRIVVIDSRPVILGSLNPLSQSSTREVMLTIRGAHFAGKILGEQHAGPFSQPPDCGGCRKKEVDLKRRKNGAWYWRCRNPQCPARNGNRAWTTDAKVGTTGSAASGKHRKGQ